MQLYEIAYVFGEPHVRKFASELMYDEFLGWLDFFDRRPVGWREDDRTHKLMQAFGVKEKPWVIFGSLEPIYRPKKQENNTFDVGSLKSSLMFQKMMTARGGDQLDL
jgi:hypothetical protein